MFSWLRNLRRQHHKRNASRHIWSGWRKLRGMLIAPIPCGITARVCCWMAIARVLSPWRLAWLPIMCGPCTNRCITSSRNRPGAMTTCWRVRTYVLPAMEKMGPVTAWVVDETGMVKKGSHSVGVARQYCGRLGKTENSQVAVSLSVATATASLPIAWHIYLRRSGPTTRRGARKPVFPMRCSFKPSHRSHWRRFGKRWRRGCRREWCWRMKYMDRIGSSGVAWRNCSWTTRWRCGRIPQSGH